MPLPPCPGGWGGGGFAAPPATDKYAVMDAATPADPAHTALLFPGQGSQTEDMREQVARACPRLLERVMDELGDDPFERVDEGTAFAQPALYCASLAGWTAAGRPDADFMAGHSLGELAALVAAGSLSESDGLWLAVTRGRLMQEAAESGPTGGMVAALGNGEQALAVAERLRLTVANDNAPGQLVLSGPADALDAVQEVARDETGARARRLDVTGAFHSPLMEPAADRLRAALEKTPVHPMRIPVYSNGSA